MSAAPKFYTPAAAAEFLTALGVPISKGTLDNRRVAGTGPRFRKLGASRMARVLYTEADLLEWLDRHVRNSTSDTGRQRRRSGAA